MYLDGASYDEIAKELDRSRGTCIVIRCKLGLPSREQIERDHKSRSIVYAEKISEELLRDRDRREAAREFQDYTGRQCGDPLPGYSALDQRRRA